MVSALLVALFTGALAIVSAGVTSRGDGYGIIGGVPAKITELPHQVYLVHTMFGFFCGGSIISRNHILTAGHCVIDVDANDVAVVLGTDDRSSGDGETYRVAEITVHENYTAIDHFPSEALNDVAVLKLVKVITLSDKARIIALSKPGYEVKDGTELIASGWGMTAKENYDLPETLRKVAVPKVSFDECHQAYAEIDATLTEEMLCAGGDGAKGTFLGDSGGALIEQTKNGNLQVGISSWCHDYHKPGFPDVFTRVSEYYEWINNIVKQDSRVVSEIA